MGKVASCVHSLCLYRTIAVLGAGLMGAGIAQVSIVKDYKVILKDMNLKGLARGHHQIQKGLDAGVKKKKFTMYVSGCSVFSAA